METVQGPCGGDGDATLAATRDGRGQRLTSGGCRDDCAVRLMVQATPKAFCVLTVEERPPGGGQALPGALRAGFRAKAGRSQVWFQQD